MKNENKQHFFQKYWLIVLAPCLLLQVAIFERFVITDAKVGEKKNLKNIFEKLNLILKIVNEIKKITKKKLR